MTALLWARFIASVNLCIAIQRRVDGYQVRGRAETYQEVKGGEAKEGEMGGIQASVRMVAGRSAELFYSFM